MSNEKQCKTCRFWAVVPSDDDVGTCRRYAPKPGEGIRPWPLTDDIDWCGEWQGYMDELISEEAMEI